MEEVAAAEANAGFEEFDNFAKTICGEWGGIEQEKRDVADDLASSGASYYGVGFWRLQDLYGIVRKDCS
jgi:hypothetical protein